MQLIFGPSRQRGFTLVEVLVAVSLLSVIMVALGSAMRTMAQTETRVDQRLQRMDDVRVAVGFLGQVLGRVSGRKLAAPAGQGGPQVPFRATAQSIEWVGVMPARHGLGGRHFFRLQVEEAGPNQGRALVLRFAPWDAQAPGFPDWSQATPRTLVAGVTALEVKAQGRPALTQVPGPEWPVGWASGWPVAHQLPERIMLAWSDGHGAWPDLVVPVRELTQGAGVGGGFVLGGSR